MLGKIFSLSGSWKTTAAGIAEAIVLVAIEEVRNGGTLPDDLPGWLLWISGFLRALSGYLQKDFNKTNATVASTQPQTIPLTAPLQPASVMVKGEHL